VTGAAWVCGPDDDVHAALDIMKERRVRRLPVVADGSLMGIISLNDLALAAGTGKPVRNEEIVDTFKAICASGGARRCRRVGDEV
jgi:CBS domain-containing protein